MISIATPSRGRPAIFREMYDSALATANGDVEIVVYLDDDDPWLAGYFDDGALTTIVGPRTKLGIAWNEVADACSGDIVGFVGDDCRFRTQGWDSAIQAVFASHRDPYWCVYADDGYQHEALATHPFLHREWRSLLGSWLPPFPHGWTDTWVDDVARRAMRLHYVPRVQIEHLHPAARKAEMDETYVEGLERMVGGEERFRATERERIMAAVKLTEAAAAWRG